jgi:hypothetical protein
MFMFKLNMDRDLACRTVGRTYTHLFLENSIFKLNYFYFLQILNIYFVKLILYVKKQ